MALEDGTDRRFPRHPAVVALRGTLLPAASARPAWMAAVRGSLVTTVPVLVAIVLGHPAVLSMAFGAWLTTLCDVGGPYRIRATAMAGLLAGSLVLFVVGFVVGDNAIAATLTMGLLGMGLSLLRVFGSAMATVSTVLVVLLALVLGRHAGTSHALFVQMAMYTAGGAASMTVALLLWPIHRYLPARSAVAACFATLATTFDDLRSLSQRTAAPAEWDAFVRRSHRAMRAALQQADAAIRATRSGRASWSGIGDRLTILAAWADRLFEATSVVAERLEVRVGKDGALKSATNEALTTIEDVLRDLEGAARRADEPERLTEALAIIGPKLASLAPDACDEPKVMATLLRVLRGASLGMSGPLEPVALVAPRAPRLERLVATLRPHLTTQSFAFVHALRVGIATAGSMLLAEALPLGHGRWAVIASAVTLQPTTRGTWSRTVERILGTAAGAMIVGGLSYWIRVPGVTVFFFGASVFIAMAVKPLSYVYYTSFVTSAFVLLAQLSEGRSGLGGIRILYTLVGALVSVATVSLLWRGADERRLRESLRKAVTVEQHFVGLALARLGADPRVTDADLASARRDVGLANNNAEETLEQLRREGDGRYQDLDVLLTCLRRLAAATMAGMSLGRATRPVSTQAATLGTPTPVPGSLPPPALGQSVAALSSYVDAVLTGAARALAPGAGDGKVAHALAPPLEGQALAMSESLPEPLERIAFVAAMIHRSTPRLPQES